MTDWTSADLKKLSTICEPFGITEKWTKARAGGFQVVADGEHAGVVVRESNNTDPARRCVYWQTRNWLQQQGLIVGRWSEDGTHLKLTPAGWRVAYALLPELAS